MGRLYGLIHDHYLAWDSNPPSLTARNHNMPRRTSATSVEDKTDPLIKEIRERYAYATAEWKDIREEAATDMRYVSGNPWSQKDLDAREATGRPALTADEISQYTNQAINNFRQNQVGIKINPAGNGATDQTASTLQGLIRGIEYDSNAQRSAYIPAYENALQRSYGFFKITRQYLPKSFNQKIVLKGVPNPDTILYDPDVLEADWSDAGYVYELNPMSKPDFKRKYPKAKVQDFTAEHMTAAKDWIREDHVVVASYWKAEKVQKKLLLIETPEGETAFYEDELEKLQKGISGKLKVIKERMDDTRQITQYITNGVEILETLPQPGIYIPIVPVIGKEMYIPEEKGNGSKRVIVSLVRLARDPYMAYCYLWSQMAEEAKMTPKAPVMGYVGQFETDKDAWDNLTSQPRAYVQVDVVIDGASGQVLPLPTRPQFTPNFPAYVQAMEAAKRAIQAAMGINPLPTAAQRQNEKSGVALGKIQQQESVGSFHFTDNIHRALEFAGKIIVGWAPITYDTERDAGMRLDDGTHKVVKINTASPYQDDKGKDQHFPVSDDGKPYGDHMIEVTTGPSFQSQRDEAKDMISNLINNLEQLPLDPHVKAQFMALLIKFQNLGPLGDQMAALLDGTSDPQQLQQKMGQMQQAGAQAQQMIQQLQAELQKLQAEKQGKVVDNEYKLQLQQLKNSSDEKLAQLANDVKILGDFILAKRAQADQELEMYKTFWVENHNAAHDIASQQQDHANAKELADQQHANTLEQGQQSGDQQSALADQNAANAQAAAAQQPQGGQ